jgi:hypothetical protein
MLSDWILFLAYPNLFGVKGFVVVVVYDSDRILLSYLKKLAFRSSA